MIGVTAIVIMLSVMSSLSKAQYTIKGSNVYAVDKKEFNLTCSIGPLSQSPAFLYWRRNGTIVLTIRSSNCTVVQTLLGEKFKSYCESNGSFKIFIPPADIKNENNSVWKCENANGDKTAISAGYKTVVYYPPVVDVKFEHATEGDDVVLTCDARGYPADFIYKGWVQIYKNTVVRRFSNFYNKKELILPKVTYQDSGTYKCMASNNISNINGSLFQEGQSYLDIKFRAIFSASKTFYTEMNYPTNIEIPFFSNPFVKGLSNFTWFKNQTDKTHIKISNEDSGVSFKIINTKSVILFYEIPISVDGQAAVMDLVSFSKDDIGNYTISVHNMVGKSQFTFGIIPSAKPDHPTKFAILNKTSESVTVTWLRGFNGGHKQFFVVIYKTANKAGMQKFKQIPEIYTKNNYTLTISQLEPKTTYRFLIYAYNKKGNSTSPSESTITAKTLKRALNVNDNLVVIGLAAGCSFAIVVIAIIVILVVYKRRKFSKNQGKKVHETHTGSSKKDKVKEATIGKKEYVYAEVKKDTSKKECKDNPAFLYATVQKPNKKTCPNNDHSRSNMQQSNTNEDIEDRTLGSKAFEHDDAQRPKPMATAQPVYAEVKKPKTKTHSEQNAMLGKEKLNNQTADLAYESYDHSYNRKKDDTTVSSKDKKQKSSKGKISARKNVSKEGLSYADLEFSPLAKKESKLVIRGNDNRIEYSEVDLSKKPDTLPSK